LVFPRHVRRTSRFQAGGCSISYTNIRCKRVAKQRKQSQSTSHKNQSLVLSRWMQTSKVFFLIQWMLHLSPSQSVRLFCLSFVFVYRSARPYRFRELSTLAYRPIALAEIQASFECTVCFGTSFAPVREHISFLSRYTAISPFCAVSSPVIPVLFIPRTEMLYNNPKILQSLWHVANARP